jgi:hypothetical protein
MSLFVPDIDQDKFPGAGNFAGNFSLSGSEFGKFCPKSENFVVQAGIEQGFQGICQLTNSRSTA